MAAPHYFLVFDALTDVLWATGWAWTLSALLAVAPSLLARDGGPVSRERSELLRYGLPRVPGDIALGALLTVPGYVALRTHGLARLRLTQPGRVQAHAIGCPRDARIIDRNGNERAIRGPCRVDSGALRLLASPGPDLVDDRYRVRR